MSLKMRCLACGQHCRQEGLLKAGSHQVEVIDRGRSLGRGRGFEWNRRPLTRGEATTLRASLLRALAQVDLYLSYAASSPGGLSMTFPEPDIAIRRVCPVCHAYGEYSHDHQAWVCPRCDFVL